MSLLAVFGGGFVLLLATTVAAGCAQLRLEQPAHPPEYPDHGDDERGDEHEHDDDPYEHFHGTPQAA